MHELGVKCRWNQVFNFIVDNLFYVSYNARSIWFHSCQCVMKLAEIGCSRFFFDGFTFIARLNSHHSTHHWRSKWKRSWWGCITLESTQRMHIEHSIMKRSTKCVRNAIQNSVANVHLLKRWNEDIQWIQSNRLAGEKDPFECKHREFISLVNIKRQHHLE